MKFIPTAESVSQHKVPEWYNNAKFGIFIHWSLFSVPAFAPTKGQSLADLSKSGNGFENSMKYSPYAEWYLNTSRISGTPTQKHHFETYGENFNYFDFQKTFEEKSKKMNPDEWADFFREAGAKYVVLVTKHHDGYCLWPSKNKNPLMPGYQSSRDLVGEITNSVRSKGLKMGLYYSGIFDWTFKNYPIKDLKSWITHQLVTDEYAHYATAQMYELIEKYKPSILWNDIGYPAQYDLNRLFADYYNAVPDGVINDRWRQYHEGVDLNKMEKLLTRDLEEKGIAEILSPDSHFDYKTPEYAPVTKFSTTKWEATRGIGMSFGYNQMETEDDMLTSADIIWMIADSASKNGNVLMNVGPMADGTIPEMQKKPLLETGKWLRTYGEAIYDTTYCEKIESTTADGTPVRFTQKDGSVYALLKGPQIGGSVVIKDFHVGDQAKIVELGLGKSLEWHSNGNNLQVHFPESMPARAAYALKISKS